MPLGAVRSLIVHKEHVLLLAGDVGIEWASDNDNVATISAGGIVTAKGNGTANITVTTKDQNKTATCVVTVAQWVTSISFDKTSITLNEGQEQTLTATVNPSNAADKSLNWTSSDTAVATVNAEGMVTARAKGNATIKATANDGSGVSASCSVDVYRIDVPQAVDMGTVVNGKNITWALFNIGASSPEEYGLYYAWGETEPKENYSWSTYKFGASSSGPFSKYNTKESYGTVDNKTVLDPEDDVAHVKLGGNWRMPTDAEWTELRTKCTWTWTTNYNGTGVTGRIVTATNGNSIFLPAAGNRSDTRLYDAGSLGIYWSSSRNTDDPGYAWDVYFNFGNVYRFSDYRCYGLSVRPVSE